MKRTVPRVSLNKQEAAEALGMSVDHFERHVQDDLRCVYSGRLRLFSVAELQRWVDEHGTPPGRRAA